MVNLSLGGPRDRLLERLLDAAAVRGIAVVGAVDPDVRDGGFPASYRGVLAVAGDDAHDAPVGVLLGPGRDIPTTTVGGKWGFVGGSSFAAAHLTGLVALLRELAPNLPPQQIREALAARAMPSLAGERHAIVDACAAIARTAGTCACGCEVARAAGKVEAAVAAVLLEGKTLTYDLIGEEKAARCSEVGAAVEEKLRMSV